jgi:hypothetical protein
LYEYVKSVIEPVMDVASSGSSSVAALNVAIHPAHSALLVAVVLLYAIPVDVTILQVCHSYGCSTSLRNK